jgi:sulfate permease, SulP family
LFQGIRPLSREGALRDILAGLQLAAMNIPQALGYTKIAGTPVVTGLYTLLLPPLAFATFGSSRYLVVAADSATAAILAGGLAGMAPLASARYVALAGTVALLTAAMLLAARILKLGFLADFLSQTVLVGFLTGVGFQVMIAVLGSLVGIEVHSRRALEQLMEVGSGLDRIQVPTMVLSVSVAAGLMVLNRLAPKLPAALIAVMGALAAGAVWDFAGQGIAVVGAVAGGFPHLGLPDVGWKDVGMLIGVAGSCVVMIVAQSAATARVYAVRHQQRLDENEDLIGLSAANAAAALSGTFVVNGSPTQTAMVERSGGQSQLAQVATAGVVALVLLHLTKPLESLPQCVLGALVFVVALRLIDLRGLRNIGRESRGEFWLALATAAVVVLAGVEQGIVLAMVVSLLRVVRHSYRPHSGVLVKNETGAWESTPAVPGAATEAGLAIYRFGAALFYANVGRFADEVQALASSTHLAVRWIVVDAEAIPNVDYTAAQVVLQLHQDLQRRGIVLAFVRVAAELRSDLDRHHLTEALGPERIFRRIHDARVGFAKAAGSVSGPSGA